MSALAAGSQNSLVVDVLLRTLGMEECADTLVSACATQCVCHAHLD